MTTTEDPIPQADHPIQGLVACHTCGYEIPPVLESTCPECGHHWTRSCEIKEKSRAEVTRDFPRYLKATGIVWFFILLMNAIGAGVVSRGNAFSVPIIVMLGIGFGVVTSLGIGIWICKLGPTHQLKLHAYIWIRTLWCLHAPWLSIAVFTIAGSIIAFFSRLVDQDGAESLMGGIIILCFGCWALISIGCVIVYFDRYSVLRHKLSIVNAKSVVTLHVLYALLIWLGSVCVGFIGGVMGTLFISYFIDPTWMDF